MSAIEQTERRLALRADEREQTNNLHEALLAEAGGEDLNESQKTQARAYRARIVELDDEIREFAEMIEQHNNAVTASRNIRAAARGAVPGTDIDDDGIAYRTMAAYARDVILAGDGQTCSQIAAQFGDASMIEAARSRIQLAKRTPANTLSSDVAGLQPPQFIDQIFQVINKSRPLVAAAPSTSLVRGTLTYPKIAQRPVVAVQATEKTEAGNQSMHVSMQTTTASTYLGGGDLSWQALNWSTPDALQLWFDLAAADYALKTEQDAAKVVLDDAFTHEVGTTIGATPTFADLMTAIGAGYAQVFSNSGRIADTVILSPDRFGYLLGMTSTPMPIFVSVNGQNIGPLNIVTSRGLDSGVVIVGDIGGLLVAETPNAPVELRVVEPAIGGLEVGIIGAFEAVVVDPGAFSLITTAS